MGKRYWQWRLGLAVGQCFKRLGTRLLDAGCRIENDAARLYVENWCKHEFTYWERTDAFASTLRHWLRKCTKCGATETTFAETEPQN